MDGKSTQTIPMKQYKSVLLFLLCTFIYTVCSCQSIPSFHIKVSSIPADGIVLYNLSLSSVSQSLRGLQAANLEPAVSSAGEKIDAQWIPAPDFASSFTGTLLLFLPNKTSFEGTLQFTPNPKPVSIPTISVESPQAQFVFAQHQNGVFPLSIKLKQSNTLLSNYVWNDRLVDANVKQYYLRKSAATSVTLLSSGAIANVVRLGAAYTDEGGNAAPGNPSATYDWFIFKNSPLVFVKAYQTSKQPQPWKEHHFLEWLFSSNYFTAFGGDNVSAPTNLTASRQVINFNTWAALISDQSKWVMLAAINTSAAIYDGYGEYGTYLLVQNPNAWAGWNGLDQVNSAWLWIGQTPTPFLTARAATADKEQQPVVEINTTAANASLLTVQKKIAALPEAEKKAALWKLSLSNPLRQESASQSTDSTALPATWQFFKSGNLGLAIDVKNNTVNLVSLFDLNNKIELSAKEKKPLFEINVTNTQSGEEKNLLANDVWSNCTINRRAGGFTINEIINQNGININVTATAIADTAASAWHWKMIVKNNSAQWSIASVTYPQIAIANLGSGTKAFYPEGPGVIINQPYNNWSLQFVYPSGWATMQYMCVYNTQISSGLYMAREDATASTKNIQGKGNTGSNEADFSFTQAAQNIGKNKNDFELTGDGVWQLLNGDWYDAAMIYKRWIKANAPWYAPNHSLLSLQKVDAWLQLNAEAATVVPQVESVKQLLPGANLGLHWYNWQTHPFDNDYPHYFPARPNFGEGVLKLTSEGVFVMPYINARLWDTRDDGIKDVQFTKVALPASTKDNKEGKLVPHTETYGSKESDGSPVLFAVMCPSTSLWQDTIKNIVDKLAKENVSGVYLDEIANADPVLCMDASHGHPAGGGYWWVDGYNTMLKKIKKANPNLALTTEENAEPYMKYLDGYLTWYWHFNGMVPAFSAVYSGAVVLFGRSYSQQDIGSGAFKMKVAQQLVFGEQLGWMDSKILLGATGSPIAFFTNAVGVRHTWQSFFNQGEMMRPPVLTGTNASLTANWNIDNTMVTTNAVQTCAWKIGSERKMIFIFCNASDNVVNGSLTITSAQYGLPAQWKIKTTDMTDYKTVNSEFTSSVQFSPNRIQVWEAQW